MNSKITTSESMKKCPYCAEMINVEALKCRYCSTWLDKKTYLKGWTRSYKHRKLLGVCAGLSKHLTVSVTLIRLAFIVLTFMGGWGLVIYLVLWLLMPWDKEDK